MKSKKSPVLLGLLVAGLVTTANPIFGQSGGSGSGSSSGTSSSDSGSSTSGMGGSGGSSSTDGSSSSSGTGTYYPGSSSSGTSGTGSVGTDGSTNTMPGSSNPAPGSVGSGSGTNRPGMGGTGSSGTAGSANNATTNAAAVQRALANDPSLAVEAGAVIVTSENGKIVLQGAVSSESAKRRIEQKARTTATGANVDNRLTVSGETSSGGTGGTDRSTR
jgi:osmotically-inducible protein OsmY